MNNDLLSICDEVAKIICRELDIETVDYNENLIDLGLDSLKYVKLIIEIEDYYDIEFPDEKLVIKESNSILKLSEIIKLEMDKK